MNHIRPDLRNSALALLFGAALSLFSIPACDGGRQDSGRDGGTRTEPENGQTDRENPSPADRADQPPQPERSEKPGQSEAPKADRLEGMWRLYHDRTPKKKLTEEQKKKIAQLEAIGYSSGSKPPPMKRNVTIHKKSAAYRGLNLYTSGHGPEAILIDMEGEELHRWRHEFDSVWPDWEHPEQVKPENRFYWRRAHLAENGDLFAIFEGYGLIRVDKDSKLLWAYPGKCHHDLHVVGNERIFLLTREGAMRGPNRAALVEYITVLDMEGKELSRFNLEECFVGTPFEPMLEKAAKGGDRFHPNTIEVLDGRLAPRSELFAKGNVLVSIRNMHTVAVIDPSKGKVLWAVADMWKYQHQPTVLDNGNMLIFDNLGYENHSRVLEFDPFTREEIWQYHGEPPETFHSTNLGSCQRLPNGNTLITESDFGRAFEVTGEGRIVWEFVNPHRGGKDKMYIATLFEVVRLPADFPTEW